MAVQVQTAVRGFEIGAIAKELLLVAIVTIALTIELVGIETADAASGIGFKIRFGAVIWAVVYVVLARLGLVLIRTGQARPALVGALAVAAVLSLVLLFAAPESGLAALVPFHRTVVNWAVVAGALTIALRAMLALRRANGLAVAAVREERMDRVGARVQQASRWLGPALLLLAVLVPIVGTRNNVDQATLVLTYVMLGWGLNIVVGLAGLLDLGYVAFYALGAYSYGLLAQHFGFSFWVCLPLAGLMSATFGVLLGFPVLRLRGDYLAIVTLGFGEIIRIVLLNWWQFTGGPNGITGVPRPSFFGFPFTANPPEGTLSFNTLFGIEYSAEHRVIFLFYVILALALLTNLFTLRIRRLPIGRAWEALREDEIACRALGINPTNTKLTAFAIGAMFGGFAGSFFATRNGFVSPEGFNFTQSAVVLAIVVLGGMGSQVGVVLAALLLIAIPEFLRELEAFRMWAFGAAMVGIMLWRPRGLLAHREPTIHMRPARAPP